MKKTTQPVRGRVKRLWCWKAANYYSLSLTRRAPRGKNNRYGDPRYIVKKGKAILFLHNKLKRARRKLMEKKKK